MRTDGTAAVPASLAAYLVPRFGGGAEAFGPRVVIEVAMARFADLPPALCCAHVSEWSMYYFAALIAPTVTLAVCTGRVPPAAIDELVCVLDPAGRVTGFASCPGADQIEPPSRSWFEPLVAQHLDVVVARCSALSGLSRKVLWSNAAVVLDYVIGELRSAAPPCSAALREAETLLEGTRFPQLARPFRGGARRTRKVCCLRFRLLGDACASICPRDCDRPESVRGSTKKGA